LNEGYGTKTSLSQSTVIGFETLEVDKSSTPSTPKTQESNGFSWSYYPAKDDTPRKTNLKRKIQEMAKKEQLLIQRVTHLQKMTHRQKRRIENLTSIIKKLQNNGMITHDIKEVLLNRFGTNKGLFFNLFKKVLSKKNTKHYKEDIRQFAITLHYFSPRAYNYVRNVLKGALPHYKTLSKWYKTIDAEPGFTSESFEMLKKRNKYLEKNICCSLVLDEMSLRQHVEWVNDKVYGLVNVGNAVNDENMGYAREVLVFMIVAINESWKVPLGYFFVNSLNSEKKANLINHCLQLLEDCKITVTNITFDCCPTNLTMAKILGCKFDFQNYSKENEKKLILQTKIRNENTFIFPDPSHFVKLIRNTFAEKGVLLDDRNEEINFNYLRKLNELQEKEGLHLCNKINKRHINFFKQKMKVKLATQLLSKSVAEALMFCAEELKIKDFINAGPTIKFISMMNDAFDILNSKKISDYGFKQALCEKNIENVQQFFENLTDYVTKLKDSNGILILNSNRKTGFLCMLISMKSLLNIYKTFVDKSNISFIPAYKMSQDHLELFFGSIRSCGGYNNNPTCRQFTSAYKKILIHAEIREHGVGNCIPLQNINILKCTSNTNKKITDHKNESVLTSLKESNSENITFDHDYVFHSNLSQYSKEIVIYISGFVAKKVLSKARCTECSSAVVGSKENLENTFLAFKNQGGLIFPSDDIIQICMHSEVTLRSFSSHELLTASLKERLEQDIFNKFTNKQIFLELSINHDQETLEEHLIHLVTTIIAEFYKLRMHHNCKSSMSASNQSYIRTFYNKLILFKGQ